MTIKRKKTNKRTDPLHGNWGKSLGKGAGKLGTELAKAANADDESGNRFKPVYASTWRQMQTAKAILKRFRKKQIGVLLADDVGLGKTYVSGILAAIYATTGKRIRVVAPSELVKDQWFQALSRIVAAVSGWQGSRGYLHKQPVKSVRHSEKLMAGQIAVSARNHAKNRGIECDLLIVDEAHRGSLSKSEASFINYLATAKKEETQRVLLLTATPFSIDPTVLVNLIKICCIDEDRDTVAHAIKKYGNELKKLHGSLKGKHPETVARDLAAAAKDAVERMKPYVIRHSRERLVKDATGSGKKHGRAEAKKIGEKVIWDISVDDATHDVLELLVRMDRAQRIAKSWKKGKKGITNDARFHSGWAEFDSRLEQLEKTPKTASKYAEAREAVNHHVRQMKFLRPLRKGFSVEHPKVAKVADAVAAVVRAPKQQRVLVFCHHIKTALEIGRAINRRLKEFGMNHGVKIAVDEGDADLILSTDGKIKKARDDFRRKDGSLFVFVATDKLSEGLDFHEQCTRLVHFEYSPSPLRTIQREGRLLRILGGTQRSTRRILIASPVFKGTRDERLAEVMKHRLKAFDLLLGGVQPLDSYDDEDEQSENIRQQIFDLVKKTMGRAGNKPPRLAVN